MKQRITEVALRHLALGLIACGSSPVPAAGAPDSGAGAMLDADAGVGDGGSPCVDLAISGATQGPDGQCSDYNPLRNVYWGDLHDHTAFSIDSYAFGNRRSPADAYAYALGKCSTVVGRTRQIDRPLDFVVVSDHSEYIGATDECLNLDSNGWAAQSSSYCESVQESNSLNFGSFMTADNCPEGDTGCIFSPDGGQAPPIELADPATYKQATTDVWALEVKAADDVYQSHLCSFTSLPAYEWTAQPNGNTMHNIVVFANDTVPAVPLDYLHYDTEESMLTALSQACTGDCDAITIQHNMNLSGGMAWAEAGSSALATLRAHYSKLVELHQYKGNSECVNDPADGNDPLCTFEYRVNGSQTAEEVAPGYARAGLAKGLAAYSAKGQNAYAFGFVGATDNHQATPGEVRESTWTGSNANSDSTSSARLVGDGALGDVGNPGGITGVWAEENLRPNIFGALQRREVFATSGPRIALRFYQTWTQGTDFCADPDFPSLIEHDIAANGGATMGGTITPAKTPAGPPRFVVFALRDPLPDPTYATAADLAEEQLVKGVYDPGSDQTSVTVQSQSVGSPPLAEETGASFCHTFVDSAWDAAKPAYYYPRVLQVPTWRWSHYDCAQEPSLCQAATQDVKIQERAWGSPVWALP